MVTTAPHRRSRFAQLASVLALALGLVTVPAVASPGVVPSAQAAVRSCSSTTPVASRPQVRRGDTGSCVRVLQQALIAKGYSVGSSGADGSFGPATDRTVRRFQSDRGLKVDGLVGPKTWGALVNGGTSPPPPTEPPAPSPSGSCSSTTPVASRPQIRQGDSGSCVRVLQRALIAKGYSVGSSGADGAFGPATDLAVRRFQSDYDRVTIDGVVGPQTWGTLVDGGTRYSRSTGPNRTSRVVLSFDDCPTSYSSFKSAVLGAENLGIALVLFPTGNCISTGRFSASYARSHGHYVFNHSISHPDLTKLSYSSVRYQLGSPGIVTSYGRPPYGAYNTSRVLNAYASKSMRVWTWTVDTRDWEGKSQSSVVSYAVNNSRARSTVLMHMQWRAFNPTAISQIKSGLAARGLGVCRNRGATSVAPLSVNC